MMYVLGATSRAALAGVHPVLRAVVERAITYTAQDFGIPASGGARTPDEQRALVDRGVSQTMASDHVADPSRGVYATAVDLVPYAGGRLDWSDDHLSRYDVVAQAVRRAASELGASVAWGGDWTTFKDYPHWYLHPKPAQLGKEASVADDKEPHIDDAERDAILDHVVREASATVDQVKDGLPIDASDTAESLLDLVLLALGAILPGPAKALVALVGGMGRDLIVGAVESAERASQTEERLKARIDEILISIEDHEDAVASLEETEKKEVFEAARIQIHRNRIATLRAKAARLSGMLPSA